MCKLHIFEIKAGKLVVKEEASEKSLRTRYFLEKEWLRELATERKLIAETKLVAENEKQQIEAIINMMAIECEVIRRVTGFRGRLYLN